MEQIDLKIEGESRLREILARIPFLSMGERVREPGSAGTGGPDLLLHVQAGAQPWILVCEVKRHSQPRHVREAALRLKRYLEAFPDRQAYGVLIAPYISPEAGEILHREGLGYLDFAGNCRLSFDHVYVERSGARNPFAMGREQRSLFAPKSARVLRVLLGSPLRAWRVVELAERAGLSLGQVSNVRKGLIDREWAKADAEGLRVERPDAILDAWREAYSPHRESRNRYHTVLHGAALDAAVRAALAEAGQGAHALLASFSAARWIAPFARVPSNYFYADEAGEALLKKHLKLDSVSRGENIVVDRPKDEGVFAERIQPAPAVWCTGLIQTYLDLAASGERGAEAAEHLRTLKIAPLWKEPA